MGSVRPENIAILSPYNAQVAQIKEKLQGRRQLKGITVTTITKSQGDTLTINHISLHVYIILVMLINDKIAFIRLAVHGVNNGSLEAPS